MNAWERISGCMVGFARGEKVGSDARARASGSAFNVGAKAAMARAIMGGLGQPARFDPASPGKASSPPGAPRARGATASR